MLLKSAETSCENYFFMFSENECLWIRRWVWWGSNVFKSDWKWVSSYWKRKWNIVPSGHQRPVSYDLLRETKKDHIILTKYFLVIHGCSIFLEPFVNDFIPTFGYLFVSVLTTSFSWNPFVITADATMEKYRSDSSLR